MLLDATDFNIQQRTVVQLFQDQLESGTAARRAAIVAGGMLARLQIGRIANADTTKLFTSLEEAELWLLED